MNPAYLFVFGNAPELAEEELAAVYPNFDLLGGTVKIAEIFDEPIIDKLTASKKPGQRIIFGLSGDATIVDAKAIKAELEDRGFKARFILPRAGDVELSSVVVTKQKVDEIYLVGDLKAKTIWVQDFQGWNKRDYGRPAVSPHVGMLPPKVARMMVNVAKAKKILDPFCGVGTILAEGLTVGLEVVGSDINPAQVTKTKKNLAWLGKDCPLFVADARSISQKLPAQSIDAVVTEPDLGPRAGLEELYLQSLSDWRKILRPGGRVVMAIPSTIEVVDKAKVMGYSFQAGPFPYFRPQARVRRNIYILTYGTH